MKKLTLTLIVIALSSVLPGCGKTEAEKKADVFIQPYTKEIPRIAGKSERVFMVKPSSKAAGGQS